jgi:RIO kinase 2
VKNQFLNPSKPFLRCMSSADLAVKAFKSLEVEDFRILQVIEASMSKREFVPRELIAKFSKLPLDRVDFILGKLNKLDLTYRMRGAYVGHTLNYTGYDCLAINALVKAGIIGSFGQSLGVGKEADVFDALTADGKRIAVKFHRLGRTSFRQTRRKRGYIKEHVNWLYQSHLAAEKEFHALKLAFENKVSVPEPLMQNRHVIAMGIIEGAELANWRGLPNAKKVLRDIMRNVKRAYLKAHIIHGDLSEYNIIMNQEMRILIIDWPQYVLVDHPNASELLERDLMNVLTFFKRRYKLEVQVNAACEYVLGKTRSLVF